MTDKFLFLLKGLLIITFIAGTGFGVGIGELLNLPVTVGTLIMVTGIIIGSIWYLISEFFYD